MKKQFISMEEARQIIINTVERTSEIEEVPIWDAVGRVCGRDLCATQDQPPFDRSPLDGFAMRAEDTAGASKEHPVSLVVKRKVYAGDDFQFEIEPGEAVRIMTGAGIPYGADCVIRQEDVEYSGIDEENVVDKMKLIDNDDIVVKYDEKMSVSSDKKENNFMTEEAKKVTIFQEMKHHDNICDKGEDIRKDTLILAAGEVITSAHGAVLAGQGHFCMPCVKSISVGVISTGSELVEKAEDYKAGKIYNSNGPMLTMRLKQLGMHVVHECCADQTDVIQKKIEDLLESQDVVITTGGVSVGEKDYLPVILERMGAEILFQGVAMKPGSPMMAAMYQGKLVIALSGNPFAAAATLELIALPGLLKKNGRTMHLPMVKDAVLNNDFPKASKHGRRFIRAKYADGQVMIPDNHSSGSVATTIGCNCLVDIPAGTKALAAGETVQMIMQLSDDTMLDENQYMNKKKQNITNKMIQNDLILNTEIIQRELLKRKNLNYQQFSRSYLPILCICGAKNSGKTTLMEKLIALLTQKGVSVAAIKHDGHDFEPDVPETDSYRFRQAGAATTAIYSAEREAIFHQNAAEDTALTEVNEVTAIIPKEEQQDEIKLFQHTLRHLLQTTPVTPDLILVEGLKNSTYPKIETIREDVQKDMQKESISNPQGLLATYGNVTSSNCNNVSHYHDGEESKLVEYIVDWMK